MSNALVPIDDIQKLALMLSKSALLPPDLKGKEADIAVTVMAGRELGLGPMASLRSIHVVKGKPVLSADVMTGLVLASGLAEYFVNVESTDKIATYETKRKGSSAPQRLSFTIEQATKAGLGGDNWKKYPDAMLRARAKAALARDAYSDVLAGCYTEDEAAEFRHDSRPAAIVTQFKAPTSTEVIIDAEVVDDAARLMLERIVAASSTAELTAIGVEIAGQPDAVKKNAEIRAQFKVKKRQLREAEEELERAEADHAEEEAAS